MIIMEHVFSWGLVAATLAAEVFLLKWAPLRPALLMVASQLISDVWLLVCLGLVRQAVTRTDERAIVRMNDFFRLWEKLFYRDELVPRLLSDLLFALSIVGLEGDWYWGARFAAVRWILFRWDGWFCSVTKDRYAAVVQRKENEALFEEDEENTEETERSDGSRS